MHPKDVKSVDELKSLGSIDDLIHLLELDLKPLRIGAHTYEELFEVVLKLRRNWVPYIKGPFLSKQQEYIYYLTQLDGRQRSIALGISDRHYADKSAADRWFKKIASLVHPDKGGDDAAFIVAKKLHDVMVESEADYERK